MRKIILITNLIALFSLVMIYIFHKQSNPTIKYFPIDPEIYFEQKETTLTLTDDQKPFTITWKSDSKSSDPIYLRQDISLLYRNGKLVGFRNRWKESENHIHMQEQFQHDENSLFQSISYHHGESHNNNSDIKSIQGMTYDQLYIFENNNFFKFMKEKTSNELQVIEHLEKNVRQNLLDNWNQWINDAQININDYHLVPLTDLKQAYQTGSLPLPEINKEQIIGQLWEGLYKNYVLPSTDVKDDQYIPIILFANNKTHLKVLFNQNKQVEQLIQKYP